MTILDTDDADTEGRMGDALRRLLVYLTRYETVIHIHAACVERAYHRLVIWLGICQYDEVECRYRRAQEMRLTMRIAGLLIKQAGVSFIRLTVSTDEAHRALEMMIRGLSRLKTTTEEG